MKLIVLILLSVLSSGYADDVEPRVKTPLGGIKGYYKLSHEGRQYEAYEGIPYAIPPVGKLRFKPPQEIMAWPGELQAMKFGSPCLQYAHVPQNPQERVEGAEDCLYLNIYTPVRDNKDELIPVFFWIHGGAFQYGTGMIYNPKYLMDSDVILVTINYRLGPLGFLSTEDDVVPGNMGLKDQSMALRWVSENIESFGGDSKKVTLVGLSAGGASVHYHYLSPLSAGLFQNGISLSGTALDCWTQTENSLEKAKKLGSLMGCPTENNKELVRCLKYRPSKALVQAVGDFMPWLYNPFTPFGPVVEKAGDAPFINRSPIEVITSGAVQDVPWITGVVSEEGLYPVAEFAGKEQLLKELDDNWESIAPHLLDFNYTVPKEKHVEIARKIKEHYFGSKLIDKLSVKSLIQMVGDRLFVVDAEKAARVQAKVNESPVWFYYFSYKGASSTSEFLSGTKEDFGVSHADDARYILDLWYKNEFTTVESLMQKKLISIWVSYAMKKVPDIGTEWHELDSSKKDMYYLHIASPDRIYMELNSNLGEKNFWRTIDFEENKLKGWTEKDEF
ncbi:venom carboxylesterase-6 [Cephus cinctus]|uniref:Carboxylic ester hydrolase n=1 Tax=Cephus cinctus TaxID=211228 RepID=A0AAJ7BYY0_CEPCN|nr:venom carboxylesterase-6 [Cephus cinctus]